MLEFASVLWRDDSWILDENAGWVLVGLHDEAAVWTDFRKLKRGA